MKRIRTIDLAGLSREAGGRAGGAAGVTASSPLKYRLAIFDFDGTLADSFPFFLSVFNGLAERHGFRKIAPEEVPALRHYGAREMMKHVGLPSWKLPLVAGSFIALMKENAGAIPLFDRVSEMLRCLSEAGVELAVISSNSHDNAVRILGPDNARLISHFDCGMSIFGKASRIGNLLAKTGIQAREAIYIGDQVTDLEAARREGVPFGAVAWGYGTIESLRAHSPEEEFTEVLDIARIAGESAAEKI